IWARPRKTFGGNASVRCSTSTTTTCSTYSTPSRYTVICGSACPTTPSTVIGAAFTIFSSEACILPPVPSAVCSSAVRAPRCSSACRPCWTQGGSAHELASLSRGAKGPGGSRRAESHRRALRRHLEPAGGGRPEGSALGGGAGEPKDAGRPRVRAVGRRGRIAAARRGLLARAFGLARGLAQQPTREQRRRAPAARARSSRTALPPSLLRARAAFRAAPPAAYGPSAGGCLRGRGGARSARPPVPGSSRCALGRPAAGGAGGPPATLHGHFGRAGDGQDVDGGAALGAARRAIPAGSRGATAHPFVGADREGRGTSDGV